MAPLPPAGKKVTFEPVKQPESQKPLVIVSQAVPVPVTPSSALASEVSAASEGLVLGMGVDMPDYFDRLDRASQSRELLEQMKDDYQQHFKVSAAAVPVHSLGFDPHEKAAAHFYLSGRRIEAAAELLVQAAETDHSADDFISYLDRVDPNEMPEVLKLLEDRPGGLDALLDAPFGKQVKEDQGSKTSLRGKSMPKAREQAEAMLRGDPATSMAMKLRRAMSGLRAKSDDVLEVLESASRVPGQMAKVAEAYSKEQGPGLPQLPPLRVDLGRWLDEKPLRRDEALALLDGKPLLAAAHALREAVDGGRFGLDRSAVAARSLLRSKSQEERQAILEEYQGVYKEPLAGTMASELKPQEQFDPLTLEYKLSPVDRLDLALQDKNMGQIRSIIGGRSKEELKALDKEFRANKNNTLANAVRLRLSGSDQFEVEQGLKGYPTTPEEAVGLLNAAHDFQRAGARNVGSHIVDLVSNKGEALDASVKAVNEFYRQASQSGPMSDEDKKRCYQLIGYGAADLASYQAVKEHAGDLAAVGTTLTLAYLATAATEGAASPLVGMALAGATTAVGRPAAESLFKGADYRISDWKGDAATGFLTASAFQGSDELAMHLLQLPKKGGLLFSMVSGGPYVANYAGWTTFFKPETWEEATPKEALKTIGQNARHGMERGTVLTGPLCHVFLGLIAKH